MRPLPSSVLLLSADPLFSHVIIKLLIRHDIPVVHTSSFTEAMKGADRFRALILDLDGRGFGGSELVHAARSGSELPILAMSEANDPQLRASALKAGACDAMGKAYMPEELIERVRGLLRPRVENPLPAAFSFARPADLLDSGFASRR
jgi:DNA-binding response OmpR family regulator